MSNFNKFYTAVLILFTLLLVVVDYTRQKSNKLNDQINLELKQEMSDISKQHLNDQIRCLQNVSYLIKQIVPPKEKFETGLVTVQLSMGSFEDMKKEEVAFRDHIEACSKSATAQFCVPELEEHVKVISKTNNHFLVIEKLTMPWAVGICNFLWNSPDYPRWARDSNHTCREWS